MEAPRVYRKGESFRSLNVQGKGTGFLGRIAALRFSLGSSGFSDYQVGVLERACDDLLDPPQNRKADVFWLRPHVLEEIDRLEDADLGRYLFHRYRYDIFPVTKELDDFPKWIFS